MELQSIKNGVKSVNRAYIIGEAGNNHNGDVELAKKLIDVAIEAGCNAVKFQKRDYDYMYTGDMMDRPFTNFPEWGKTEREVRKHIEFGEKEFREVKKYCEGKIDLIVTPFDIPSFEFLEELGVDAYKIASHSLNDIPLIEAVARSGKPVIMSISMADEEDVKEALKPFKKDANLVLLHCISSYPMKMEEANMQLINWLKRFSYPVGFSDHENGITMGPVARTLGALFFEKHYTTNRALPGFDHAISLEPEGLHKYIRNIRKAEISLQGLTERKGPLPSEMKTFKERRKTVVSAKDIKKGQKITRDMLTTKGPNVGIQPKMIPEIVGKEALEDIPEDTHITMGMIKW